MVNKVLIDGAEGGRYTAFHDLKRLAKSRQSESSKMGRAPLLGNLLPGVCPVTASAGNSLRTHQLRYKRTGREQIRGTSARTQVVCSKVQPLPHWQPNRNSIWWLDKSRTNRSPGGRRRSRNHPRGHAANARLEIHADSGTGRPNYRLPENHRDRQED